MPHYCPEVGDTPQERSPPRARDAREGPLDVGAAFPDQLCHTVSSQLWDGLSALSPIRLDEGYLHPTLSELEEFSGAH